MHTSGGMSENWEESTLLWPEDQIDSMEESEFKSKVRNNQGQVRSTYSPRVDLEAVEGLPHPDDVPRLHVRPHVVGPERPVVHLSRAATVVGIPKISRYTDFFQNSVFLEAKGGALLYVQKSVKLGIFATFFLKSR